MESKLADLQEKLKEIVQIEPSEIGRACSELRQVVVKKDDLLIREGTLCRSIYFIQRGLFRAFLNSDGREVNSEFFLENEFAGAFTGFSLRQTTAINIQALEDSLVVEIPSAWLEKRYRENPEWLALGKFIFEEAFIKKCKRESSFLQQKAKQRYLDLIDQYPAIEQRVALRHIASYLGIQPESLSRIRSGKISDN